MQKEVEEIKKETEEDIATLENECLDRDAACKERVEKMEEGQKHLWEGINKRTSKEYMYHDVHPKLDNLASQLTELIKTCVTKKELTHIVDVMNKRIDNKVDKG